MPEAPVKYPFNSRFQSKILALLLRDPQFLSIHGSVVEPGYFDNPVFVILCRRVINYYKQYKITPSEDTVRELVKNDITGLPTLAQLVDEAYSCDLGDASFIQDKAIDFARSQAMRKALDLSRAYLEDGNIADIQAEIDRAAQVGTGQTDLGADYFSTIEARLDFLNNKDDTKIPTLIDGIDTVLGGGITRGELNVVMAPSSRGKSIFLVNMAYAGLFQKYSVLFVTLEMSANKIGLRLDSRFTGIPLSEMGANPKRVQDHLALFEARSGKLRLKHYPSTTAGVEEIRNLTVNLQRQTGFKPDLLIVDYLDIMKPMNKAHVENPYLAQGEVAKALRGFVGEFNMGLWTATQTSKAAFDKDVIEMKDKADSYRVIMDADVVLGIMRNKEDWSSNRGRLSFAKLRDGDVEPGQTIINVRMDFRKMLIASLLPEDPC
jgi:replicative DNA helicase